MTDSEWELLKRVVNEAIDEARYMEALRPELITDEELGRRLAAAEAQLEQAREEIRQLGRIIVTKDVVIRNYYEDMKKLLAVQRLEKALGETEDV